MGELISKYWQHTVFAMLTGATAWIGKNLLNYKKDLDHTKNGVKALLRNEIIRNYNHYMDKECLPIYALENMEAMYKEYKALNGNGAIDGLMEKIRKLPTDKE